MELKILNLTDHLSEKMRSIYNEILHKSVDLNKKREVSSFIGFLPLTLYELVVSFLLIYWVNIIIKSDQAQGANDEDNLL